MPLLVRNLAAALPYAVAAVEDSAGRDLDKIFEQLPVEAALESPASTVGTEAPEDALFLQFSGGTTGAQKCVVVTGAMLETQLRGLAATLGLGMADSVVSWLPMASAVEWRALAAVLRPGLADGSRPALPSDGTLSGHDLLGSAAIA